MAYVTAAAVRSVLIADPTDAANTPAELTDAAIADKIAAAQAQVDAALSRRYPVPFTAPPDLVVHLTAAIAAWLVTLTYRRSVDVPESDPVALRYRWAADQLAALASGAVELPDTTTGDGGTPAAPTGPRVINTVPRVFTLTDFGLREA